MSELMRFDWNYDPEKSYEENVRNYNIKFHNTDLSEEAYTYGTCELKQDKDKYISELEDKLKTVCSILLKKDQMYDAWIEKNIGSKYVQR